MLAVIRMWLKAPVQEPPDETGRSKGTTGGKDHSRGTPQGGVASPLLANIYMNRFLKAWRLWKMGEKLKAKVVNYADDFVILCRGTARQALNFARRIMGDIGLKLNEEKTKVKDAFRETFDFLGYTFGPQIHKPTGRKYQTVVPSRKAVKRYRERVRQILNSGNNKPWEDVAEAVNRVTCGWARYFSYGTVGRAYWWLDAFLLHRAQDFLRRRHKVPGRGTRVFTAQAVFSRFGYGLESFAGLRRVAASHALA
jgi:RNA-directed DNA polymerase